MWARIKIVYSTSSSKLICDGNISMQRLRILKELTALNDYGPPHTWEKASVRP